MMRYYYTALLVAMRMAVDPPGHYVVEGIPQHFDADHSELLYRSVAPIASDFCISYPQYIKDCITSHFSKYCMFPVQPLACIQ